MLTHLKTPKPPSLTLRDLLNRQLSSLRAGADSQPFLFIALFSGLILIILLVLSIAIVFHTNPYGPSIKISGLNKIPGLPRNEKDFLEAELYKLAQKNLLEADVIPTSGAYVVKNTITSSSDNPVNDNKYHSVRFLVDVKPLEMSFVASVEWTSSRTKSALSGYPVTLTCPTLVSETLYPDTPCADFISDNLGSPLPLFRYLPYTSDDFLLLATDPSATPPKLEAILLIHSFSTPSEEIPQKSAELKQAVENYIKSTGSSPDDYSLTYKIEYGD